MKLKKYKVCSSCWSVGILDKDCICAYQRGYKTVELEFEVCECCDNLISDGNPAETEFNEKQLKEL